MSEIPATEFTPIEIFTSCIVFQLKLVGMSETGLIGSGWGNLTQLKEIKIVATDTVINFREENLILSSLFFNVIGDIANSLPRKI